MVLPTLTFEGAFPQEPSNKQNSEEEKIVYKSSLRFSVLVLAGLITLSGCATKKYVRKEVGGLEPKIAAVDAANKDTSEKVDGVDRRAQTANTATDIKATAAGQAAGVADGKAGVADGKAVAADAKAVTADGKAVTADRKADTANQSAQQAITRINGVEGRLNAFDSYTTGDPQAIVFKVDSDALSAQAKLTLDAIASSVAGQQSGFIVEIQGFTDSTGDPTYNVSLSQRRAESTLRYLIAKGLPLHRASIVGLGQESPVGDNKVRTGREQNRRVEVRVLQAVTTRSATN